MTNDINYNHKKQDVTAGSSEPPGDLTRIVRFLARCAAERAWKKLQANTADPPTKEGDRS